MTNLVLVAPMDGWAGPLDEVPDAVFADRMMGDGLAIDPAGAVLRAPCAGHVIAVHRAKHAVSLRAANGAEILIHIGLETVALEGRGFDVHVGDGQMVKAGDALVTIDLDFVARHGKSLLTPIIVTNGEGFSILRRAIGRHVEAGDFLMELRTTGITGAATKATPPSLEVSRIVTVSLAHGIHARPAARLSELAKSFSAEIAILAAGRRANARSPIALMSLAVRRGQDVNVTAVGSDAEGAVDAVAALIEGGMGESAAAEQGAPAISAAAGYQVAACDGVLRGVSAVPGLAIGRAFQWKAANIFVAEAGVGIAVENQALTQALAEVALRLSRAALSGAEPQHAILQAHRVLLDDPELIETARALIAAGKGAGFAWRQAVAGHVQILRSVPDARIAERVTDLVDLERQILMALTGEGQMAAPVLPEGAILLAEELLPSELVALQGACLAGICTARGGPTSHVAIMAAAMNLPTVVAAGPGVSMIGNGTELILDADMGELRIDPGDAAIAMAEAALARRRLGRDAAKAAAHLDCTTADGTRIEIFANLGSLADARAAVAGGAEGCGLLRTEFLFLDRTAPPDEDEQLRAYQDIARELDGRPLIIRTLDIGGDKPAPYLPIPKEDNPALGLRGVRVGLWRPELLRTQLRAIMRVEPQGQCRIMVPMVTSLGELRAVRTVVEQLRHELGLMVPVALGIMIETPAAAMTADLIAAEADFFSVGTNDLSQYTLAMDRGNPDLAVGIDALHPGVLRMIAETVKGARKHGRWTGVCGGLASDLAATPILIGLGITELSVTNGILSEIKALVRTLSLDTCRKMAQQALKQESAAAVRDLLVMHRSAEARQ